MMENVKKDYNSGTIVFTGGTGLVRCEHLVHTDAIRAKFTTEKIGKAFLRSHYNP